MAVPVKNPGGALRLTIVTKDKASKDQIAVITDGTRLDPGERSFHAAIPEIMEQIVERARQQLGDILPAELARGKVADAHPSAAIEKVKSLQAAVMPTVNAANQAVMELIYAAIPKGEREEADFYRPEINPNCVFTVGETVYQPERDGTVLITSGPRSPKKIKEARWFDLDKGGFFDSTGEMADWDVHVDTPQLITAVYEKFAGALTKAGFEIDVHKGVTVEDARGVMDQYRDLRDTMRGEIEQARQHMVAKLPADWSMVIPTRDDAGVEQPWTYFVEKGKFKARSDAPDASTQRVDGRGSDMLTGQEIAFAKVIPEVMGQISKLITHQMALV